jgi:tetratricopeptide (TPR) repeat protein
MRYIFLCFTFLFSVSTLMGQRITEDTVRADVLYKKAETLQNKNLYDSATLLYRQSSALYARHLLWEKHITCGKDEVNCLTYAGKLDSAVLVGERYVSQAEKQLGEFSTNKAMLLYMTAIAYYYQSRYENALNYLRKSLAIHSKVLGEKHQIVSVNHLTLANVYYFKARYKKALDHYQKSLRGFDTQTGKENLTVAKVYNNIAIVYDGQAQYLKALDYYHKSLDIKLRLLGDRHTAIAGTYNNMAIAYGKLGQLESSLDYYQKAIGIYLEIYGEKHLDLAEAYSNIATVYKQKKLF